MLHLRIIARVSAVVLVASCTGLLFCARNPALSSASGDTRVDSLTLVPGNSQITVSWKTSLHVDYYNIYFTSGDSLRKNSSAKRIERVSVPFTVTGLANMVTYTFGVTEVTGGVESPLSAVKSAKAVPAKPPQPSIVTIAGNGNATVYFDTVVWAQQYNLYWTSGTTLSLKSNKKQIQGPPVLLTGLVNDSIYKVAVTAVNGLGETDPANFTIVKPLAPSARTSGAGMKQIAGGVFRMGNLTDPSGIAKPVHRVTLSSFYMDTTEVTQADYERVMGTNPSVNNGDSKPVEFVTWYDAILYCNARSRAEGLDTLFSYSGLIGIPGNGCTGLTDMSISYKGNGYRLPTESEWEYACRGGTTGQTFYKVSNIDKYDWYAGNSLNTSHAVARKRPNPFGLYDINGNVWEFCIDSLGPYPSSPQVDPWPPATGPYHVLRGGAWDCQAGLQSSTYRYRCAPYDRNNDCGFRCVKKP